MIMKRFIAFIASFALVICLLSCSCRGTYEDGYADGYDDGLEDGWCDGYDEGYSKGYYEGIAEAQHDISVYVEDDLSSLAWDIDDTYGMHPEDAIMILANHADDPEAIEEEELNRAIWAIYRYYYNSHKIINGIEDYWID